MAENKNQFSTQFDPSIDSHTHLFPETLTKAIRKSLNKATGWEFSNPTGHEQAEKVMRDSGVERYAVLPYAHKKGIAEDLNQWVLRLSEKSDMIIPCATIHPEDSDKEKIVRDAFEAGSAGLKIHCPVQECKPADPRIESVLEIAIEYNRPITYHGGTAPMFEQSTYVGADVFQEVIKSFPRLRVCCAHMGAYECEKFLKFAEEEENVYLDTTFSMSSVAESTMDFNPRSIEDERLVELSESIMYGSDFVNIPYPYREERADLLARGLPTDVYRDIFYNTALTYFGLD